MCASRKHRHTASRYCSTISNASAARRICGLRARSFSANARYAPHKGLDMMVDEHGKSRLGRGLAALIGDVGDEAAVLDRQRSQRRVPIEFLKPNPRNPRRVFGDAELDELAASIRERGIIQPILVRTVRGAIDQYEIVA